MGQQTRSKVAELAVARSFLVGLAAQDFRAVRDALAPAVHLRALLPGGLREWTGAEVVAGRFERWFGDTERFDPVAATVGEVARRVHLVWRFRLEAARLGPGRFVVEQSAYADVHPEGGIAGLDVVCSGYLPEACGG